MNTRPRGFVLLPVVLLLALLAGAAWLGSRETGLDSAMARGSSERDKARLAAEAGLQRAIVKMHDKGCSGLYPIPLLSPVKDTAFDGASYSAAAESYSGSPVTIASIGTYGSTSITLRREVPMHMSTPYTVNLQPGAAGQDTFLQSGGSVNGDKANLTAVAGSNLPLLRFDLSSLPAGSHVTSATLQAYATGGSGSGNVALHRVTRDWTEAATWTTSNGSTAWTSAGGDAHATAVASAAFTAASTWLSWDVTELTDKWLKGSLPNQGVQPRAASTLSSAVFASSDHATAGYWPKLSVTFLPPCDWTPPDTTVTLTPIADTDIEFLYAILNFGNAVDLWLSKDGFDEHPLLQFNTSAIASGKTVVKATLRLYLSSLSGAPATTAAMSLEARSVTKAWNEAQATWLNRLSLTAWTAAGGDYRSFASGTLTLPKGSTPGTWVEIDVTSLTQGWVDGTTINNGLMLLVAASAPNQLVFSSRESPTNPPQLVVTYH